MALRHHILALLYKNWITWKRKLFGSLCELLFPIFIIFCILLIRLAVTTDDKDEESYLTDARVIYPAE